MKTSMELKEAQINDIGLYDDGIVKVVKNTPEGVGVVHRSFKSIWRNKRNLTLPGITRFERLLSIPAGNAELQKEYLTLTGLIARVVEKRENQVRLLGSWNETGFWVEPNYLLVEIAENELTALAQTLCTQERALLKKDTGPDNGNSPAKVRVRKERVKKEKKEKKEKRAKVQRDKSKPSRRQFLLTLIKEGENDPEVLAAKTKEAFADQTDKQIKTAVAVARWTVANSK